MTLCMAAVVAVLWSGLARTEVTNPDGVAVIIGNKDYAHTADVEFAHRDAEAFARYVVEVLGFDPKRVLLLRDAPLTQMIDTFGRKDLVETTELWSRLKPGRSDVVVFYSGHGVPGLRDKRGYLMPVDARPEKAELMGYSLDLLHENLGKLDTRSVTVFVDSCFSGDSEAGMLFEDVSAVKYTARLPEGETVTMITAAAGNQVALWDREAGHGLFTRHLLDGLYGDADADRDGRITAGEAKSYLDEHMTGAAREGPRRTNQTATLRGGEERVLAVARFPGRSSPGSRAMAAELAKTRQEKEAVGRQRDRLAEALKAKEAALGKVLAEKEALEQRRARLAREVEAQRAELAKARREQERLAAAVAEQEAELKRLREKPRRTPESVEAGLGLAHADRVAIQRGLVSFGKRLGRPDGVFGERTRRAISEWQEESGEEPTGHLTGGQAEALRAAGRAEQERAAREKAVRDRADAGRHGREFRDCEGCPEMVVVGAGEYWMGSPDDEEGRYESEGPRHRVKIGAAFAVGKYEVTRSEYGEFVTETGRSSSPCLTWDGEWKEETGTSWVKPGIEQGDRHPVVCVSWEDAKAYAGWLSDKTGENYRLLTEAEWEYVARGGTRTSRYWGDSEESQCEHANGADERLKEVYHSVTWVAECRDGGVWTADAGSYRPNGFGLYDVSGNVWEWVEDCWHESYRGAPTDGSAWTSGGDCGKRVLRGGSWVSSPRNFRSANRSWYSTGFRNYYVGFRIARTLTP